jgi:regulator of cell morphogenesis and NO signaling
LLRDELRAIEELLLPLERDQRPLLVKVRRFRREQEAHLSREERVLFPLIEELESARAAGRPPARRTFGPLRNAIAFMREDHLLADRYLARLHGLIPPGSAPLDEAIERLRTIEADLRLHVAAEEDDLFPAAVRLDEQ